MPATIRTLRKQIPQTRGVSQKRETHVICRHIEGMEEREREFRGVPWGHKPSLGELRKEAGDAMGRMELSLRRSAHLE